MAKASGNYKTMFVSWDQYFKKLHGGLGAYFMYNVAGKVLSTSRAAITYAPRFNLFNEKLLIIPSAEFAFQQKQIDWSALTFGDMIDPQRGFVFNTPSSSINNKSNIFDISTGLLIATHKFYAGFSAYHITQPNESFNSYRSPLPTRFNFHSGYTFGNIDSSSSFSITPGIIYVRQQDFSIFYPSIKARYRNASLSFAYRTQDAFIVGASVRIKWIELGYSYDNTYSKLTNTTNGAHEIHLGISFKRKMFSGLFLKQTGL